MLNHLLALLNKNWILWRRSFCCSCCELFLPTLLIFALIGIRTTVDKTNVLEKSYVDDLWFMDGPQTLYPVPTESGNNPYFNFTNIMSQFKDCHAPQQGGVIGLYPPSSVIIQNIDQQFQRMNYQTKFFSSGSDFDSYVQSSNYGSTTPYICFAIDMKFEDVANKKFQYALRFNTSGQEIPSTENPRTDPIVYQNLKTQKSWFYSGWLTLQNYIDNLILNVSTNSNATITTAVTSIRVPAYLDDPFPNFLTGQFGVYLVLPLMIIYLRMTYAILYEKEKKIKEGMKIMGLQNTSFYLSWTITYFIIYTIISIIATILLNSNVFPNTNGSVIWLVYWLFCMTLIFQSFFITVFFSRALFGLIVAIVFYLLQFLVITLINSSGNIPSSSYWAASICPHSALSFAFDVMIQFEVIIFVNHQILQGQQKGVSFDTLGTEINNYSVMIAIIMDVLNILFYLIMGVYLDQVFPNEWGMKKHPLFFLQCFFKQKDQNKNIQQEEEDILSFKKDIEEVEAMIKEQESRNSCVIVKNLSKKYPSGKHAVNNLSLTMYEGQIFALLGHNGAGKTTTISMLTGMIDLTSGSAKAYGKDIENEIGEIRKFMGVCPQHDILFDNLTVKEHLEMFATFKGVKGDQIQQEIRKMIEDVDLIEKTDYLAKNLSGGQKRKLSVAIAFIGGSKLIYLDEPTSGMDTSARRYIWQMLKNYKSQRIVVLTTHFMDEADFLGDRIGIMSEGKLMCCGSSVFLKNQFGVGYNLTLVKKDTTVDSNPIIKLIMKHIKECKILSNVSAEVSFQLPMADVVTFPQLFEELDSNLEKLQVNSYGISITTLEEVFLKVAQTGGRNHQLIEEIQEENQKLDNFDDDFDMNSVRITNQFISHTIGLLVKRLRYFKRDFRSLVCEIFLPCAIVVIGLSLMTITFFSDSPSLLITPRNFSWQPVRTFYDGITDGSALIQLFDPSVMKFQQINGTGSNYSQKLYNSDSGFFNVYNIRQDLGWYFFNEIDFINNKFNYLIAGNSVQKEAFPMMMNQMNQAILKKLANNNQASIEIINEPMKLTQSQKSQQNSITGFLGAFVFTVGMSFIPASVISYIVKEREINIKHQQLVSGVSIGAYWFSNFIMDVGKHIIPAAFCSLMVIAFDISAMRSGDNYGATWLLFFLYGWAIIPFSYAFSFLFRQQGNALLINFFMHLVVGALLSIIWWVMRLIESTRSGSKIAAWFLRLLPSFAFSFGIINMSNASTYASTEGYSDVKNVYDFDISGGDILYLGLEGFFYMSLVFLLEALENSGKISSFGSREGSIPYQEVVLDDDVIKENEVCDTMDPKSQAVLVRDIRKVYMIEDGKHKVAVEKVSFSVANGEVFGLLGVNGAGKTTTFKMLSGEIKPTRGQAWIAGSNVITHMADARRNIGYCPQFDALLENLTVQEHLELFTIVKGIPANLQQSLIAKKLKEMNLEQFKYIQAGLLSGGNKRKLSVAIAMIGNPPIVFLDEPSTGMDPEARRFMWNVISRIATQRKQSSIILTTHSMEEAEALSTKIAIQVEGNLRCIGSVQHIKNKFGQGYEIEVKVFPPSQSDMQAMIQSLPVQRVTMSNLSEILQKLFVPQLIEQISPNGYGSQLFIDLQKANGISIESLVEFILVERMGQEIINFIGGQLGSYEILEHFQTFYRFKLKVQITVGKLFGTFEANKNKLKISQYSIRQATLEQIFNNFAHQRLQPYNNQLKQVQIQINQVSPA